MKISIRKRDPDKRGLLAIRLVYYYGLKNPVYGSRAQNPSYKTLNLFLYARPKNALSASTTKSLSKKPK